MLTCIRFLTSSVGLGATCQVGLGATYVKAKDPIFKASPGRQSAGIPTSSPKTLPMAWFPSPTPRWLTKNLLAPMSYTYYTSITPATLFLVVLKPRQARFSFLMWGSAGCSAQVVQVVHGILGFPEVLLVQADLMFIIQ